MKFTSRSAPTCNVQTMIGESQSSLRAKQAGRKYSDLPLSFSLFFFGFLFPCPFAVSLSVCWFLLLRSLTFRYLGRTGKIPPIWGFSLGRDKRQKLRNSPKKLRNGPGEAQQSQKWLGRSPGLGEAGSYREASKHGICEVSRVGMPLKHRREVACGTLCAPTTPGREAPKHGICDQKRSGRSSKRLRNGPGQSQKGSEIVWEKLESEMVLRSWQGLSPPARSLLAISAPAASFSLGFITFFAYLF